jgi:molybdopterin molybdotransferase
LSEQLKQDQQHREAEEDHTHYHGVDKAEEHISVENALEKFLREISPLKKSEIVTFSESLGRICDEDVKARFDIPRSDRSTRDGFAIKIGSTMNVAYQGSEFRIIGEVPIGKRPHISVKEGEAAKVATGSFIPKGSNSIVMKEYCEVRENGSILVIRKEAKIGDNILRRGEDIPKRTTVLSRGTRIWPHHIALLAMVGVTRLRVYQKPRVAFFSTGDELVDVSTFANKRGKANDSFSEKISDVNRPFIESMTRELGAVPVDLGIARDDFQSIRKKIVKGLSFDALLLSAGSSVGEKDYASKAAESLRGVKTLVHGVAMRPSSPTALATYKGKPFIMLPGFPTSMIVSFLIFAGPAILKIAGSKSIYFPRIKARLEDNDFQGKAGVTNFVRVRVVEKAGEYLAKIVRPTEAQFSSWLKEANGIGVAEHQSRSSLQKGDLLDVFLIADVLHLDGRKDTTSL